ncbi:MAG: DNA alkylation repair protein [Lachnospiraceae bacterium]|nr:DNA alkylation repair protein [Lachnospiraceae bacterium]
MNTIVSQAVEEVNTLASTRNGEHIATGEIRKLSARLYRKIEDKTIGNILDLCEELLEERSWALGVIAFDWAYRVKKQYDENTYDVFYGWLKKYVRGWGDCDDFCTHAFGELLRQDKSLFKKVKQWTGDEDFWVRRASAVVLIPAILHNDYDTIAPFEISDALMSDQHDLVQKGYGWMLKCLSQVDMEEVKIYLIANCKKMPRTAYRYALEKFDKQTRSELMKLYGISCNKSAGDKEDKYAEDKQ